MESNMEIKSENYEVSDIDYDLEYESIDFEIDGLDSAADLLSRWGLQEMIPSFREEGIGIEHFSKLKEYDLQRLTNNKKLVFLVNLRDKINCYQNNEIRMSATKEAETQANDEDQRVVLQNNSEAGPSKPRLATKEFKKSGLEFNIKKLLLSTAKGRSIIEYSVEHNMLNVTKRNWIVDIIVEFIMDECITPDAAIYMNIVENIVKLFPGERTEADTYYKPSSKIGGKYSSSSGKLLSRFHNRRAALKKQKKVNDEDNDEENEKVPSMVISEESQEKSKSWLKTGRSPLDEVEKHWEYSYQLRKTDFSDLKDDIVALTFEWPILKSALGKDLINYDFEKLFPGKKDNIFKIWPIFVPKIIPYLKENIKDGSLRRYLANYEQTDNASAKDLLVCLMLPGILLPSFSIKHIKWRPSIMETTEGFILHVQNVNHVEEIIRRRIEKLSKKSLKFQPIIIAVGEICNPTYFMIYYNSYKFKCNNLVEALDLAIKLIFVFNAEYSAESVQIWTFIQKYFFEINTKNDKQFQSVKTLIGYLTAN